MVSKIMSGRQFVIEHLLSPEAVHEYYNFKMMDGLLLHEISIDIEIMTRVLGESGHAIETIDAEILVELTRIRDSIEVVVNRNATNRSFEA